MWIIDNFKPYGRMQRGEYFMRSLVLLFQLGFWLMNVVASGLGAATMSQAGDGGSWQKTFLVVLLFGLLIVWQSISLMLRRLIDIGINPVFAIAAYALFWVAEVLYFSRIPELAATVQGIPLPVSWLGATVPLLFVLALMLLPSGPEGLHTASDVGASTGSSWADAIKLPTTASATPAPACGLRAPSARPSAGNAKAQFGNRTTRRG